MALPGEDLGAFIKTRRTELGLSQRKLAMRVGVSPSYLSQIEKGTRKWPQKYIGAIARELQVSEGDLALVSGVISDDEYIDRSIARLDERVSKLSAREFDLFTMVSNQLRLDMDDIGLKSSDDAMSTGRKKAAIQAIRAIEEQTGVTLESLRAPIGGYLIPTEQDDIDALYLMAVDASEDDHPNPVLLIQELIRDDEAE